jgi:hypothetical protein
MKPVELDVAVIGGINSDYFVRGHELPRPGSSLNGDAFLAAAGGKGANAAVGDATCSSGATERSGCRSFRRHRSIRPAPEMRSRQRLP